MRELILDTSVLIDGHITDIAATGVLGGNLIIPDFVLSELHRVADSAEPLRRTRGERGLEMLNKLQRDDRISIKIVGDDFDNVQEVDDKLVALARQRRAAIQNRKPVQLSLFAERSQFRACRIICQNGHRGIVAQASIAYLRMLNLCWKNG